VTHEFQAVTGRMILQATAAPVTDLISIGAASTTSQTTASKPSSSAVEVIGELRTRRKEVGFQTLVGSGHKLHSLLKVGAVGGVLAFAACAPTACYEIYAAFKDNDQKLADEKQLRVEAACIRIVSELGIAGIKYAADLNGFYGGNARLPLLPLTATQRHEVESLMAELKS
jgi:dihydrodipicolinate synthase/N-acetylneuraminate lyase